MQHATPSRNPPPLKRTGLDKRYNPDHELSTNPEMAYSQEHMRKMSAYDLAGYHARQADSQARVRVKHAVRVTDAYKAATVDEQRQMEMEAIGREMERRDAKGMSAVKKLIRSRAALEALCMSAAENARGTRVEGEQRPAESTSASSGTSHYVTDLLSDDERRVAEKREVNEIPEESRNTKWSGTGAINSDISSDFVDWVVGETALAAFEHKVVVERARLKRETWERCEPRGMAVGVGNQQQRGTLEKHKEGETDKTTESNRESEDRKRQAHDKERSQKEEQEETAALNVKIRASIDAARQLVEESGILAEKWEV